MRSGNRGGRQVGSAQIGTVVMCRMQHDGLRKPGIMKNGWLLVCLRRWDGCERLRARLWWFHSVLVSLQTFIPLGSPTARNRSRSGA